MGYKFHLLFRESVLQLLKEKTHSLFNPDIKVHIQKNPTIILIILIITTDAHIRTHRFSLPFIGTICFYYPLFFYNSIIEFKCEIDATSKTNWRGGCNCQRNRYSSPRLLFRSVISCLWWLGHYGFRSNFSILGLVKTTTISK
jgi:hypothetical protein